MARTTSEAEGADEADYVDPGLDRPSQAEGDVGDSDAPEDVPDGDGLAGGA